MPQLKGASQVRYRSLSASKDVGKWIKVMVTIIKDKVMVGKRWGCILTEDKEGGGSGVDAKLGGLNFLSKISIWKLNCRSTHHSHSDYYYYFEWYPMISLNINNNNDISLC